MKVLLTTQMFNAEIWIMSIFIVIQNVTAKTTPINNMSSSHMYRLALSNIVL